MLGVSREQSKEKPTKRKGCCFENGIWNCEIIIAYETRFRVNFVIDFGAFGFHFGSMLAPFFIPGVSWKFLGVFWVCLRASWGRLKRLLGATWARLGASRGRPGAFLEHLCRVL